MGWRVDFNSSSYKTTEIVDCQWDQYMSKDEIGKEQVIHEIEESLKHKLVQRREAPLIGLIAFSVALWGSKLFTAVSPGSNLIFQVGEFNIHFHHFNYGIIALVIGLVLTFFEGAWFVRIEHVLFGAGLGFVVDEYWLLLIFDDHAATYFGPEAQFISRIIGVGVTIVYAVIAIGVFFKTRREREIWQSLYEEIKAGIIEIQI